jgi:ABC-type nitrate/sulfonate/bicarbonate transport system permease component
MQEDRVIRKPKLTPVATVQPRFRSALRREIPFWKAIFYGLLCLAICGGIWWYVTRGESEARIVSRLILPSPEETFGAFPRLWLEDFLAMNVYTSLRRVVVGFALATLIGVPLGVLCGCYPWTKASLSPLTIFGRNIPIAALIPLTLFFFGTDEKQKVMFIFIATVAFIVDDTATAIRDVSDRYIDTAYTLGASQWQIIIKVVFPLALPNIFNSLRLLFGIAFGYIMLVEVIRSGNDYGGIGYIINTSQRMGQREPIILVLLIIPVVALLIDRLLYLIQRELFPYQYGGYGVLRRVVGWYFIGWERFKSLFRKPVDYNQINPPPVATVSAAEAHKAPAS